MVEQYLSHFLNDNLSIDMVGVYQLQFFSHSINTNLTRLEPIG